MKKNWKIIVGIVLIIGGIGLLLTDLSAGAIDIAVGIALVVWWNKTREKARNNQPVSKAPSASPVPTTPRSTVQAALQPTKSGVGYNIQIPKQKDGASLAYRYTIPFVPSDLDAVSSAAKEGPVYLTAKLIDQKIHLFTEETDLGILTERADMVADWLKRSDPYIFALENISNKSGCMVTLAFYRDKQKQYAHKEQTVVALTGYKGESKQNTILYLNPGDELEIEKDYEKDGRVIISYLGDVIGSLPKKYADQFINEGAALVVFDHSEEIEDSDDSKPFVKIYW